jgi:glycosyltransferase involved in cell wall biosynthesis
LSEILLVAPVPTHPSSTGASARVLHMAEALSSLGHDVRFLHLQQPLRASDEALRAAWGDRLHVFAGAFPSSWIVRGRRKLLRLTAKTVGLDLSVDAYHDPAAAACLSALVREHHVDVVILSYVFYSRLLEGLSPPVRTLIDTHDVFSERYRMYTEHGQAREFFSTSRADEGRALDRADAAIAIAGADARHFREITSARVHVVGDLGVPTDASPGTAGGRGDRAPALLFVGGPMGINTHGIEWFLGSVLPVVRREVPEAELWLVGGICDRVRRAPPGVRLLGFVADLETLYRRATLAINPQRFGTGLSIKSIDALRRGVPLVTTDSGARGIEEAAGDAFLMGDSAEEVAAHIVTVLRDPETAAVLRRRALEFAHGYYEENRRALAAAVEGRATT